MMIEIKSVSLDYGVKDLDLTIKKGEFLLLCGTQRLWKNNSHASDQRSDPGILSGRDDRGCICGRRACAGYADVSDRRAGRLGFSEPAHTVF